MTMHNHKNLITVKEAETLHNYVLGEGGMIAKGITKYAINLLMPYKTQLDDIFMMFYSSFNLNNFYSEYKEQIPDYIAIFLQTEEYNLKTLIGTLDLDYNPIENYNMKEHESGLNIYNNDKRTTNTTMNEGERTTNTTTNEGKQHSKTTNTQGEQHSSGTTTQSTAPFNSNSFSNKEQTSIDSTVDAVSNAFDTTSDAVTNTTETVTDAVTNTNQTIADATEDTHDFTRDLTRSGNIGVTTSQQMVASERDLANLNIVKIICRKIADVICEGVQDLL